MDRLTRPEVDALQSAVRFMGTEVKIQDIGDKLLHLILNGPTINSINKDTLRHLVRQLYTELKRYEDLEMTPEAIEQQLKNFSSFLMEMTGGRMSKTSYTVQAMVSEANNHFESLCDECSDRKQLAEGEKELAVVKAEMDAAIRELRYLSVCSTCAKNGIDCHVGMPVKENDVCCGGYKWRGAKDTNAPGKTTTSSKKSLLFNKRLRLAQLSETRNRENGVRECAFSTITYLHAHGLIDVEKALAFLESTEKEREDISHGKD